jgi:hypothetical protein
MQALILQKLKVELIWWVFTFILIVLVLIPIYLNAPLFPFFYQNTILVAAFVTFSRYIFLLPLTLIARQKWIKVFIIGVSAILFFVLTTALGDFRNFLDEEGLQSLVEPLNVEAQTRTMNYIKSEMLFFGVGSIIAGVILPFRMVISLWRVRNRGTV